MPLHLARNPPVDRHRPAAHERPVRHLPTRAAPRLPPEKSLRAQLLQLFYSLRSERMLMEQLRYNLLVWSQLSTPHVFPDRSGDAQWASSGDESSSYPWVGYHRSSIRRGVCLALNARVIQWSSDITGARVPPVVARCASPDRSVRFSRGGFHLEDACPSGCATVCASRAIAHTKPASSRATATQTLLIATPRR